MPISRRTFISYGAMAAGAAMVPRRVTAQEQRTAERVGAHVATVSSIAAQTMQGFGAAGAWWPNDLVKFDPGVRARVADLLFGPDGIQLSAYRYNIGGGGAGVTNPVRAPET